MVGPLSPNILEQCAYVTFGSCNISRMTTTTSLLNLLCVLLLFSMCFAVCFFPSFAARISSFVNLLCLRPRAGRFPVLCSLQSFLVSSLGVQFLFLPRRLLFLSTSLCRADLDIIPIFPPLPPESQFNKSLPFSL